MLQHLYLHLSAPRSLRWFPDLAQRRRLLEAYSRPSPDWNHISFVYVYETFALIKVVFHFPKRISKVSEIDCCKLTEHKPDLSYTRLRNTAWLGKGLPANGVRVVSFGSARDERLTGANASHSSAGIRVTTRPILLSGHPNQRPQCSPGFSTVPRWSLLD